MIGLTRHLWMNLKKTVSPQRFRTFPRPSFPPWCARSPKLMSLRVGAWVGNSLRLSSLGTRKKRVVLIFAGACPRIEGTRLSPAEARTVLGGGRTKKPEEREAALIAWCADILRRVFDEHWDIKFDQGPILQFHVRLCKNSPRGQPQRSRCTGQPRDTPISES